ncbi:2OG-Fe(II) oxygenase family protein [Falsiroseomonas sp. HW251]|uniref:2OG-Fe(II) oxygenase family protein n=1 Tax=Falsiroseomonas sp. HW251 TaxID=3390998 RepID=UPI003D322C7A
MSDSSFRPSDLLPPIALPDAAGAIYDVMQQGIAARPRILMLGRAAPAAAMAEAEARGALVLLVLPQKADGAVRKEGPTRLFDPERRLFAAFGLPDGGVAVISPRGRLAFAQAGDGAMQAAVATLPGPAEDPPVIRGGAPVLMVPDILEPDFIAALVAHWNAGEKMMDRVASSAAGMDATKSLKRRADVPLTDRALYEGFRLRVERRVVPEMWRAWRFRAASFEAPRIGCYDGAVAGAFGAHRDNRTPFTAHRRFAMSLNLNTGDYEGGQLRFAEFGPELYEPMAGGAAVFCCDLLHEALPVTRGRRFAVFTFFTDAEGVQQERKLQAEAIARGQQGVRVE